MRTYQLNVALFTQSSKISSASNQRRDAVNEAIAKQGSDSPASVRRQLRLHKKDNLVQFWAVKLKVRGSLFKILGEQLRKMTRRGAAEFRLLYPWLMTDNSLKRREKDVSGYLDGVVLLSATKIKTSAAAPVGPVASAKTSRGEQGGDALEILLHPH